MSTFKQLAWVCYHSLQVKALGTEDFSRVPANTTWGRLLNLSLPCKVKHAVASIDNSLLPADVDPYTHLCPMSVTCIVKVAAIEDGRTEEPFVTVPTLAYCPHPSCVSSWCLFREPGLLPSSHPRYDTVGHL